MEIASKFYWEMRNRSGRYRMIANYGGNPNLATVYLIEELREQYIYYNSAIV